MDGGVDPARFHSLEELKAGFDMLRQAQGRRIGKPCLSIQDVARRISRDSRTEVPRSTLANYLAGRTLPPPGAYEAILRALAVPDAELSAWADAWDRAHDARCSSRDLPSTGDARPAEAVTPQDTGADWSTATSAPPQRRRLLVLLAAVGVVAAGVGVGVGATMVTTTDAPPQPTPSTTASTSECAYTPVAVPVRVRPRPSFATGTQFQTINKVDQVVIGACEPQHREAGTTCSATTIPIDTWIPVRFPYTGWIFSACLQHIAPPPGAS